MHFDGLQWSPAGKPDAKSPAFGQRTGPNDVYAAGAAGTVLHYDGNTWSRAIQPLDDQYIGLISVWCQSPDHTYFGDDHGGVYRFDGSRYTTVQATGSDDNAVVGLAFHPTDNRVVYAATHKAGIFLSPYQAEGCSSWATRNTPFFPSPHPGLYAGTQGGMLQCMGTGVIAGEISAADTGALVDGAVVFNDLGARSVSIAEPT